MDYERGPLPASRDIEQPLERLTLPLSAQQPRAPSDGHPNLLVHRSMPLRLRTTDFRDAKGTPGEQGSWATSAISRKEPK